MKQSNIFLSFRKSDTKINCVVQLLPSILQQIGECVGADKSIFPTVD